MSAMASQITNFTVVYLTVYSGTDQRKRQSSASLAFVRGIHWWPVNSPHKRPVTRKMFSFDDIIMNPLRVDYEDVSIMEFQDMNIISYVTIYSPSVLVCWY